MSSCWFSPSTNNFQNSNHYNFKGTLLMSRLFDGEKKILVIFFWLSLPLWFFDRRRSFTQCPQCPALCVGVSMTAGGFQNKPVFSAQRWWCNLCVGSPVSSYLFDRDACLEGMNNHICVCVSCSDVWSLACVLYELCTLKHPVLPPLAMSPRVLTAGLSPNMSNIPAVILHNSEML